jgi:hypothetical protein
VNGWNFLEINNMLSPQVMKLNAPARKIMQDIPEVADAAPQAVELSDNQRIAVL